MPSIRIHPAGHARLRRSRLAPAWLPSVLALAPALAPGAPPAAAGDGTSGRDVEVVTGEELQVEEGALYPALHRMHRKGWLEAEWGLSENNRRARYYRLSDAGEKALRNQVRDWGRMVRVISMVLEGEPA